MEYTDAKRKFIHSWGVLGNSWGINKTMAQIHALLMVSPEPLTTDDIIADLGISRGNVSMSLKALIEWGIVFKDYKAGDRKDYFYSEKDVWKLATQVANERRRRELEPVIKMLDEVQGFKIDKKNKAHNEFANCTKELSKFANQADSLLVKFTKMESNWFFNKIMRMFK